MMDLEKSSDGNCPLDSERRLSPRNRQRHRKHRPTIRSIRRFHATVVLLHDRLADAQAKPCPAPRTLRRIERIKDARQVFLRDAGAVIQKADPYGIVSPS